MIYNDVDQQLVNDWFEGVRIFYVTWVADRVAEEPLAKLRSGKRCGAPVVSLKPFFGGET